MTLTQIRHCVEVAGESVLCLAGNPAKSHLFVAGAQDNTLAVLDLAEGCVLARAGDFGDSVTCARWVAPQQFVAGGLDGAVRLYRFDADGGDGISLMAEATGVGPVCKLAVHKTVIYAQCEDE